MDTQISIGQLAAENVKALVINTLRANGILSLNGKAFADFVGVFGAHVQDPSLVTKLPLPLTCLGIQFSAAAKGKRTYLAITRYDDRLAIDPDDQGRGQKVDECTWWFEIT